ncbi:hypothetical protein B5U27_02230 [Pseudomonas amygdali pv. lachrymans]|nr:hypothetical protein B5U27_02230 [Pseudomonas amygdali pv. lachrymans]
MAGTAQGRTVTDGQGVYRAFNAQCRTLVKILVPHAPRGNACRDALRHKSAPRRRLKTGRRAFRTACDAERRTRVETCVISPPTLEYQ